RQMSLWMGDLDPYMDDDFVKQAFSAMGESPTGVKIITHRITGGSAGYCFVELADEASVERCVQRLNGKLVPGSNPPRKFKLNYATYGKRPEAGPEFSVFVGDLASDVDDFQLHQVFKKYPSCKGTKVVTDQYGYSRGYGFVKFGEESEQKKAIEECQGTVLSGKALRLSIAVAKSQKMSSSQGGPGQNYSSYNQPPSSYYGSNNSMAPGGYYSQWGGYDQIPPTRTHAPPAHGGAPAVQRHVWSCRGESQEQSIPECDVEQWNRDFVERSEEFYEALMSSRWEPLDSVDSPVPSMS
uniref:tRNA selenocysteine-associated protein 1 n=1 Tax=Tetraodon nigroviridis TaxID=99883 RepID=H3C490_TETNG